MVAKGKPYDLVRFESLLMGRLRKVQSWRSLSWGLTTQEGGGKRVNIFPLVHCLTIKTIFVKIFIFF